MDNNIKIEVGVAILKIAYLRGHIPEEIFKNPKALPKWWDNLTDEKKNEKLSDYRKAIENEGEEKNRDKRRVLLLPLMFIVILLIGAIPGAIIGAITGLFHFQIIAGSIWGLLFFIIYPFNRRRSGAIVDGLTYFIALWGGLVGAFACIYIGNLVENLAG